MASDSSNYDAGAISRANEGSGSVSDADFANFLNTARRSVFEVANILMMLSNDGYLSGQEIQPLLSELEEESRMILAFRRTLKS
jgi:four helix bundle protein